MLSERTLRVLACPRDHLALTASDGALVCSGGHRAQRAEADMLPPHYRAVVHLSAALARVANRVPPLIWTADSLYVTAQRRPA